MSDYRFCPQCATPLQWLAQQEDGGEKQRLRCPACAWTHWNNPTPVLAAIIEYQGRILLARNAAWTHKMYALITGFMEAGETPLEGIAREIKEETNLDASELNLIGVYDFQRMNQVIIAYHAVADGHGLRAGRLVAWPRRAAAVHRAAQARVSILQVAQPNREPVMNIDKEI